MVFIYKIIGKEEVSGNIQIAFMGYNSKLTDMFFEYFIEDNKKDIEKIYRRHGNDSVAYFKDGTIVSTFCTLDERKRGCKIDQIILADDYRHNIDIKRYEDIKFLRDHCMYITCIPEEFQIIYYEI